MPPTWVLVIVELFIASTHIHHCCYILGNMALFKKESSEEVNHKL